MEVMVDDHDAAVVVEGLSKLTAERSLANSNIDFLMCINIFYV